MSGEKPLKNSLVPLWPCLGNWIMVLSIMLTSMCKHLSFCSNILFTFRMSHLTLETSSCTYFWLLFAVEKKRCSFYHSILNFKHTFTLFIYTVIHIFVGKINFRWRPNIIWNVNSFKKKIADGIFFFFPLSEN